MASLSGRNDISESEKLIVVRKTPLESLSLEAIDPDSSCRRSDTLSMARAITPVINSQMKLSPPGTILAQVLLQINIK